MIQLGKFQNLYIVKKKEFGVYVNDQKDVTDGSILLPAKQVPDGASIGDQISCFVYKDSEDRPIATVHIPKITLGAIRPLRVKEVSKIGAFLDWGLEKDLFLPFKEQTEKVEKGDRCLVSLYVDKSERLCATMKIYHLLQTDSPYKKDDVVTGTVYEVNRDLGAFVAVDNLYSALIPKREMYGRMYPGQEIEARVAAVKEDGKLDLSIRGKIPEQMDKDAELILECIETCGGKLPFTDKADPERIKAEMGMSKAAFKRAVGRLLKQKKIVIKEDGIYSL